MREGEKENRQRSRKTVFASLRNPAAYSLCFLSLIKVILQHRHGYEATANMHVANRHTDVCVCLLQCSVRYVHRLRKHVTASHMTLSKTRD